MNDHRLDKGIEDIKNIRMTDIEKDNMRLRLVTHIGIPVNKVASGSSPYFTTFTLFIRKRVFAYMILIIFSIGSVTVFAAEKAVPGDLLYPIKVSVTEPIRGAFIVKEKSKISWEAEKANRRLEEAEVLVERGDLSSTSRREIEDRFSKHIEQFNSFKQQEEEKNVERQMKNKDDKVKENTTDDTRIDLENNIIQHTDTLEKLKITEDRQDKREEIESLRKNINEKMRDTEDRQDKKEKKESSDRSNQSSPRDGRSKDVEQE